MSNEALHLYALGVAGTIEFYWAHSSLDAHRMAAQVHPDDDVLVIVPVPSGPYPAYEEVDPELDEYGSYG